MNVTSASPSCLLAFDVGTRRIGVASGNTVTHTATPLETLDATRVDATFAAIGKLVAEWQPQALVVGIPRHPDGQPHAMTQTAERFARRLEGRYRLPVVRIDERYTTVEAQALGREHAGRADRDARDERDLDARSAAVILEQHLRDLETQGRVEHEASQA